MDPKLRLQLIRDEGIRLEAYQDSVGLWTIGIGHLLGPSKRIKTITEAECDALFAWDVMLAEGVADWALPSWRTLDPARRRAIINMAFNLGGRLTQFVRFRQAVAAENWPAAGGAMMSSKWARQVGARAIRLQGAILTGID